MGCRLMRILFALLMFSTATYACEQLLRAAKYQRVDEAMALLGTVTDLECSNAQNYTPLLVAARNGLADLVDALIARGADVTKKTIFGLDVFNVNSDVEKELRARMARSFVLAGADYSEHFSSVEELIGEDPDLLMAKHVREVMEQKQICALTLIVAAAKIWWQRKNPNAMEETFALNNDLSLINDHDLGRLCGCALSELKKITHEDKLP